MAFATVEFTIGHVGNCHYVSLQTVTQFDTVTVTVALAVTLPTDVAPLSVDNEINSIVNTVAIANSQTNER